MGTFNLNITGRKARILVRDPKTNKLVLGTDSTPQLMQYLDERHAYMEAHRLNGLLQQNPTATVEIRPADLAEDVVGQKLPLSAWIKQCAESPLPPVSADRPKRAQYVSEMDRLLSEAEEEPVQLPIPAPAKSAAPAPEPEKVAVPAAGASAAK